MYPVIFPRTSHWSNPLHVINAGIPRQLDDKAKSFKAGPSDTVAVSTEYGADSRSSSTPYPCSEC